MTKLIVTTSWDDGCKPDLKLAELLNKYGIRATFYIAKTHRYNPLEKDELTTLDKLHEVGAHTLNHVDLTKVSLLEAKEEIQGSKDYLEDTVGHEISMFCYPYGKYNQNIKEVVRASGFIGARTCEPGGLGPPQDRYQWGITLFASNGSPLMALRIWWAFRLWKVSALLDWENRAKLLFDLALQKGGVYHIYAHSWEFERNSEWDKLERLLKYLSNREGVRYIANGEVFQV